jgi:uncharacterized protein (TIGR03435 family)
MLSVTRVLCGLFVFAAAAALAQELPAPRFEVASVKANKSGQPHVGGPGDRFSNGQFQTTNIPLRLLMRQAFERFLRDDVAGGPAWLDSDRWDIVAKAPSPDAPMLPMIRSLLADRFKLVWHFEQRVRAIYTLSVSRDGRLGPWLRPGAGDQTTSLGTSGAVTGRNITLRQFSILLASAVGTPVVDRTGLTGTYDVDLKFTQALSSRPGADLSPDVPDIFTAVREQLGLRLDSTRGPVEILVIDSVERPAED